MFSTNFLVWKVLEPVSSKRRTVGRNYVGWWCKKAQRRRPHFTERALLRRVSFQVPLSLLCSAPSFFLSLLNPHILHTNKLRSRSNNNLSRQAICSPTFRSCRPLCSPCRCAVMLSSQTRMARRGAIMVRTAWSATIRSANDSTMPGCRIMKPDRVPVVL